MGIEPTPPQLRCDALPFELLSPWEQGGGERGSLCTLVYNMSMSALVQVAAVTGALVQVAAIISALVQLGCHH